MPTRRQALELGLAALAGPMARVQVPPPLQEVRAFQLRETAGLRRFGYPVATRIAGASGGRHYRLIRDGRAIPAQFRESGSDVVLDFIASPEPFESSRYEVQFGLQVEPGPEPQGGLTLGERAGRWIVTQSGGLNFEVARDSASILPVVASPRLGYLREPGGTLSVRRRGIAEARLEPMGLAISRHGGLAVGFRSQRPDGLELELTIPGSKSWVEVAATLVDPSGTVQGFDFDAKLILEGVPTLADLGAGSTVYGQIRPDESMELTASPSAGWSVRKGPGEAPPILASSPPGSTRGAEGWAHVMDAQRCTAVAVLDFGKVAGRDQIRIHGDGRVRISRDFGSLDSPGVPGRKSLRFWLHFVPMPVQVGAATSPQAILAPLSVEWDRRPGENPP